MEPAVSDYGWLRVLRGAHTRIEVRPPPGELTSMRFFNGPYWATALRETKARPWPFDSFVSFLNQPSNQ